MRRIGIVAGAMAALVLPHAAWSQPAAPAELKALADIGAGFAARNLCSSVYLSGRSPESILAEELGPETSPLFAQAQWSLDREARTATAGLPGISSATAVHRDGLGCTLVIGHDLATLSAQQAPMTVGAPGQGLWPEGESVDTANLPQGVDRQALEAVLDAAFAPPADGARDPRTRAVVVVHKGRIVAERYAEGYGPDTPQYGASMSKSATNALVALRVADGALSLDQAGVAPEWRKAGDPRGAITLRQLMHMSSGLAFNEDYGAVSDVNRMLFVEPDAAAFAASFPLEAAPGETWKYASGTTNVIARAVRESFGGDEAAYRDFLRNRLFARIGMRSAVFETDPAGTFIGSSLLYASARDWARLGLLYLNDGVWEGERLFPEGWVAWSTTPAPASPRRDYGAQIWLDAAADAAAPAPVMIFSGYGGQSVTILPEAETVIVRLGWQVQRGVWKEAEFRKAVLAALGR